MIESSQATCIIQQLDASLERCRDPSTNPKDQVLDPLRQCRGRSVNGKCADWSAFAEQPQLDAVGTVPGLRVHVW
jgi:hypothetical protein